MSDEIRIEMLEAICHKDSHLEICDYEIYGRRGFIYETLEKIQTYNPGSEIYFVAGSDKLHIIPRWQCVEEFLAKFKILVQREVENFQKKS